VGVLFALFAVLTLAYLYRARVKASRGAKPAADASVAAPKGTAAPGTVQPAMGVAMAVVPQAMFDPNTGQPLAPAQPKFDPNTGQPLAPTIKYDAMTGALIKPSFDPATGAPVWPTPHPKFDPTTGERNWPKFDVDTGAAIPPLTRDTT